MSLLYSSHSSDMSPSPILLLFLLPTTFLWKLMQEQGDKLKLFELQCENLKALQRWALVKGVEELQIAQAMRNFVKSFGVQNYMCYSEMRAWFYRGKWELWFVWGWDNCSKCSNEWSDGKHEWNFGEKSWEVMRSSCAEWDLREFGVCIYVRYGAM